MKRIIVLINILAFSFFLQAQEKVSYKINGKNIEFKISKNEIYVEYNSSQKSSIQNISKKGFKELSNSSAILKTEN